MLAALALTLLAAPPRPADPDDGTIRIKLSEDNYSRGDRAKVKVRASDDGYLVVVRVDGDGRVRVLYPLRPDDEGEIRGGKEFEIRSRGDREAFVVDENSGAGAVLAAWSATPFKFDDFTRNGHWDYRALGAEKITGDREAGLLDLVDRMTEGNYDYDVAQYTVNEPGYVSHYTGGWYSPWRDGFYGPCYGCWYGPRWRVGIAFGFGGPRHFYRGRRHW
jgi:hypothetical protein